MNTSKDYQTENLKPDSHVTGTHHNILGAAQAKLADKVFEADRNKKIKEENTQDTRMSKGQRKYE